MKRRKAGIVSSCMLALLAAILIPVLLLPRRAADKVAVIPLRKMLKCSWVPG